MPTLKEFFEEQKKYTLSNDSKLELYHRILQMQQKHSLTNRIAQLSRIVMYSTFSLFLVGGFLFFTQKNNSAIVFDSEWVRIQQADQWPYRVSADSIGQVLQFQWAYTISNNGKFFETNMIYDGDTISLQKEAFMSFKVNGHTTKVIGPATLEIFKKPGADANEEYFIHIVEGEFVEVSTVEENKTITLQKNNVAVHKTEETKELKVQIVEEKGQTKIRNLGDTVQINTNDQETDLANKQEASILDKPQDKDITVDDENAVRINIATIIESQEDGATSGSWTTASTGDSSIEQRENIIAVLEEKTEDLEESKESTWSGAQNNIIATTEKEDGEEKEEIRKEIIPVAVVQKENTVVKNQEPIAEEQAVVVPVSEKLALIDGKKIPNEIQAEKLSALLQKDFLEYDIKNLMASMIYHKDNGTTTTLKSINTRLVNLWGAFNIPVSQWTQINIILSNSSLLIQHLSESYHIPPVYIHNLVALQQWIILLQNKELSYSEDTIDMERLINKIYQQRGELHFK